MKFSNNEEKFVKYFFLWSFICIANAATGFIIAKGMSYNISAMLLVVFIYILFFSFLACTDFYEKLKTYTIIYRSVFIGYIINAAIYPMHEFFGVLSYNIMRRSWGGSADFITTFFMTFLMGLFLNIMGFVVIFLTYFAQRLFLKLFSRCFSKNINS